MPNILQNGQWLRPGHNIKSEDDRSGLTMQEDGKIDVYHDGRCVWQNTREQRYDIQGIHMQEDGDLVMYTSTRGEGSDVYCIIQDGGNLVLYNDGDRPIWASHTQRVLSISQMMMTNIETRHCYVGHGHKRSGLVFGRS
ncbi:hypothetical protein AO1008_11467 [Aspergillus oryzae 100-8]|uniref:Bulb-type lectin domain-containing protein n=1 Tax=Aspergillus oryzae (strain 3.042) TaxID=1160506 RepID=I8TFB5_ASPO3|nr:hypothetical protein Ao3042_01418 [Aspergillus oryzae 3.042]KDE75231.1 hypothetical protein AO1008_11467 [Aspergillus oryzae 100-8]|eukprot:EIT72408.1 hypothetical protein Ao3042_01418 [Aspergillus oryzae 3.042]